MILLDTDHLSVLSDARDRRQATLVDRLDRSGEPTSATVVSLEEQCRAWLAEIRRRRRVLDQVYAYERLAELFIFYRSWKIMAFSLNAAAEFERLRKARIRIGAQDLKIASIVLEHRALLLSANLRDFRQVPGLRVESRLE
jgi:tRNA(fMet)-specific endonuclease VapC